MSLMEKQNPGFPFPDQVEDKFYGNDDFLRFHQNFFTPNFLHQNFFLFKQSQYVPLSAT